MLFLGLLSINTMLPFLQIIMQYSLCFCDNNVKPQILINETSIQLKFFRNSISLVKGRNEKFTYRVDATSLSLNKTLPTLISILNANEYAFTEQRKFGQLYDGNDFVSFGANVSNVEDTTFYIQLFEANSINEKPFAFSYVQPFSKSDTDGSIVTQIVDFNNRFIGKMNVEYVLIRPLSGYKIEDPYNDHFINVSGLPYTGHRGTGVGRRSDLSEDLQENTIAAFNYACRHNANMSELDVQLSKDKIPVIYHDFTSKVWVKKMLNNASYERMDIPVKDITFAQMKSISPAENESILMRDTQDNYPFETLKSVFESVDHNCGINVEIKYPMIRTNGLWNGPKGLELNEYVDIILKVMLESVGNRTVFITSFHPDLCSMIRLKQNRFRVAFLTSGNPNETLADTRASSVQMATYFSQSMSLYGISAYSDSFLKDKSLVNFVKSRNQALYIWGGQLDSFQVVESLRKEGADGLIFDKIDKILP